MGSFQGETRFAQYDTFVVGNKRNGYRLTLGGYNGTAGSCLVSDLLLKVSYVIHAFPGF